MYWNSINNYGKLCTTIPGNIRNRQRKTCAHPVCSQRYILSAIDRSPYTDSASGERTVACVDWRGCYLLPLMNIRITVCIGTDNRDILAKYISHIGIHWRHIYISYIGTTWRNTDLTPGYPDGLYILHRDYLTTYLTDIEKIWTWHTTVSMFWTDTSHTITLCNVLSFSQAGWYAQLCFCLLLYTKQLS